MLTLLPTLTFQWKPSPRFSYSIQSQGTPIPTTFAGLCRVGIGYDIHKIVDSGRQFKVGGVVVSNNCEIDAHSDGDVLFHSIADSIFGALGKGDIGHYFPNIPKFDNYDSSEILKFASELVAEENYKIGNIDSVIILQDINLQNFKSQIIENIKKFLCSVIDTDTIINVKAKTKEGLDSTGKGLSIECHSVVNLRKLH